MTEVNPELEGDTLRWCPICGSWECDGYCQPEIEITDNGIFKGSIIGVKATAIVNGKTFVAFGPNEFIAKDRLRGQISCGIHESDEVLLTCVRCGHKRTEHRGRSGGCAHLDGFGNECNCSRYMGR